MKRRTRRCWGPRRLSTSGGLPPRFAFKTWTGVPRTVVLMPPSSPSAARCLWDADGATPDLHQQLAAAPGILLHLDTVEDLRGLGDGAGEGRREGELWTTTVDWFRMALPLIPLCQIHIRGMPGRCSARVVVEAVTMLAAPLHATGAATAAKEARARARRSLPGAKTATTRLLAAARTTVVWFRSGSTAIAGRQTHHIAAASMVRTVACAPTAVRAPDPLLTATASTGLSSPPRPPSLLAGLRARRRYARHRCLLVLSLWRNRLLVSRPWSLRLWETTSLPSADCNLSVCGCL